MAATLDDAWARVEWAHRQLVRLDELVEPFLASKPYRERNEIDPEGKQRVIAAEAPFPPPPDITFVFGDLVHALHAALNYSVCSLVESVGMPVTTKHGFPIFANRTAFEANAPKLLRDVPNEAVKFIENVQPYHYAGRASSEGKAVDEVSRTVERMPLMRLYRLSIEEKHRALLVATSLMSIAGTYLGHNRVGVEPHGIDFRVTRARDQVEIVTAVDLSNPNERFDVGFRAKVALNQEGPDGMEIESIGRMLYNEVAHNVLAGIRWLNLIPLTNPRELPYTF